MSFAKYGVLEHLAVETNQPRIIEDYEAIRRREYALITDLLDVLPKINNVPQELNAQARDALFHADHPFLMVFVGPFNSGKSSLINALLGTQNLLDVGPVPTTDRISILRWGADVERMDGGGEVDAVFHPAPLLKKVSFVDTPGLESVFQRHEERTRRFLHRSDVVMLVMLATQAMTSSNLEYLQKLREYGKKIIILINQADLISAEEQETVRRYVLEQSQVRLGYKPPIYMVSARHGLNAQQADGQRDASLWQQSGLEQIENYIETQLGDAERLRQKLQTPLQIMQNVNANALRVLRADQSVIDQYQAIKENIDQQLTAQKREQEKVVREINQELRQHFQDAIDRSGESISDVFQISRTFTSVGRGLTELTGIPNLLRRKAAPSYVLNAFNKHQAFEPLHQLAQVSSKLGPRLEGRDLQDLDSLVSHTQREIKSLPANIQTKVIGTVQAPVNYDRRPLQEIAPQLEQIEEEARSFEAEKFARAVRSTMIYLALYIVVIVILGAALLLSGIGSSDPQLTVVIFGILVGLALAGLAFMPLVGRVMRTRYTNRLLKLQNRYIETLSKAADKQIEYGMRLRGDVVTPLTRLIEAQTSIQNSQLERLRAAEQEMAQIENELNKLGKRSILGVTV